MLWRKTGNKLRGQKSSFWLHPEFIRDLSEEVECEQILPKISPINLREDIHAEQSTYISYKLELSNICKSHFMPVQWEIKRKLRWNTWTQPSVSALGRPL